jgi:hypothetical protein
MLVFAIQAFMVILGLTFALMLVDAWIIRPLVKHWRNPPPPTAWFFAPHPDASRRGD